MAAVSSPLGINVIRNIYLAAYMELRLNKRHLRKKRETWPCPVTCIPLQPSLETESLFDRKNEYTSLLVAALLAVYIIVHYVKESTCMYKLSPSGAERQRRSNATIQYIR